LGSIIENSVIHNVLLSNLKKLRNVVIFDETSPTAFTTDQEVIGLRLSTHHQLNAQLIIGADGCNSWVRENARIGSVQWAYHHDALVTTVRTEYPHKKTAWQCFLPEGPLALLPLKDQHVCSIVWSGSKNEITRLTGLKDENFDAEITHAFERRLGNISKISTHATFPLVMRHAKRYVEKRIALVGDAAHTIHPLAGQGINLGFADALSLAKQIKLSRSKTGDCGHYTWLRKYERSRKADNWLMTLGVEGLKRLFESQSVTAIYLRCLGLNWIDRQGAIKNQFVTRAMGSVLY
jgi:2-octaprenylphenol hydroxylase